MARIAVVGGGIGGLAAALRLRAAGADVVIFEKNERVGGKLDWIESDGYYFDRGPTLLTMPFVLEDLFDVLDARLEDYLELLPINPTCRYHWSDGTRFDAFSPAERFLDEVARTFPEDSLGAAAYLEDARRMYDATKDIFLFGPFLRFSEFLAHADPAMICELPRLEPTRTLDGSVRRRFGSGKLVQLFDRFATYGGSSPFRAPASLKVISHVELGLGAFYPRGGMRSIVRALERLALERGVEIRTATPVTRLIIEKGRVRSVEAGGEIRRVDAVVGNVDVLWTYRNLLEPAGIPAPKGVLEGERSCSGFLMLASVEGAHPELEHHNIFFSDDYHAEFDDIFLRKVLPGDMTIYVSISSRTDPALAPPGCENWYLLVNAPSSGAKHGDRVAERDYAAAVWTRLERFGLSPRCTRLTTVGPVDFEIATNALGGALYGAASNSRLSPFRRPANAVPGVSNMYFVGGSTHPGGGVPLVLLSGATVSKMILSDLARAHG